jgi:hypothetical protein
MVSFEKSPPLSLLTPPQLFVSGCTGEIKQYGLGPWQPARQLQFFSLCMAFVSCLCHSEPQFSDLQNGIIFTLQDPTKDSVRKWYDLPSAGFSIEVKFGLRTENMAQVLALVPTSSLVQLCNGLPA